LEGEWDKQNERIFSFLVGEQRAQALGYWSLLLLSPQIIVLVLVIVLGLWPLPD